MARGRLLHRCMITGSRILDVEIEPPAHVSAFRSVFGRHVGVTLKTWKVLLPGLAQLWYRFGYVFCHFPYMLILLICESVPKAVQREVEAWPAIMPPRALASNSAVNIYEALGCVPLINLVYMYAAESLAKARRLCRSIFRLRRRLPYAVIILAATMDQAPDDRSIIVRSRRCAFCVLCGQIATYAARRRGAVRC